jgi:hypothetical protein
MLHSTCASTHTSWHTRVHAGALAPLRFPPQKEARHCEVVEAVAAVENHALLCQRLGQVLSGLSLAGAWSNAVKRRFVI